MLVFNLYRSDHSAVSWLFDDVNSYPSYKLNTETHSKEDMLLKHNK